MHSDVHNATTFTLEQLQACPLIGWTVSTWRQRDIALRKHPVSVERVISVGFAWDGTMTVYADETREAWATALDYIAHGKVYTSD